MRRVDWLPEWTRQSERLLSLIEVSRPDAVMRNPGFFPYAYLDGEMEDPDSVAKIEHHLGHCRICYSRIELERALTDRIKKSVGDKAPEKLRDRLRKLIDRF